MAQRPGQPLSLPLVTSRCCAKTIRHCKMSLRVDAGEHVCVLVRMVAAKSTLIKTTTRECYPVASETLHLDSRPRALEHFELRSLLGIVSPDLLASCTTDATGRDVCCPAFSAARVFFRTTRPIPTCLKKRTQRSPAWASRTLPLVRLRRCPPVKPSAR